MVLNAVSEKPVSTGQILKGVGYGFGFVNSPHRVLQSDGFQEALQDTGLLNALKAEGINPTRIASKINVLLNATKKQYRNNVSNGEVELFCEEPDYQAIDKGIKHATNIYGVVDDKGTGESKNTYNFIFSPEVQNKVKIINEDIKKLLTNVPETKKDIETEQEG